MLNKPAHFASFISTGELCVKIMIKTRPKITTKTTHTRILWITVLRCKFCLLHTAINRLRKNIHLIDKINEKKESYVLQWSKILNLWFGAFLKLKMKKKTKTLLYKNTSTKNIWKKHRNLRSGLGSEFEILINCRTVTKLFSISWKS